jgi:hypothetical protein
MAYTPTTWVTGTTPISAANLNNLETQYAQAVTAMAAVSESDPTRLFEGIYQNTSGKLLMVNVTITGIGQVILLTGPGAPLTDIVAQFGTSASTIQTMTAIVPVAYYYEVHKVSGSPTLTAVHEWVLH